MSRGTRRSITPQERKGRRMLRLVKGLARPSDDVAGNISIEREIAILKEVIERLRRRLKAIEAKREK